jgi:hypothetical protein
MKIKIENHNDGTTRVIEYPCDLSTFLWAHSFNIYNIVKVKPGKFQFVPRGGGPAAYTISKAGARDALTE